MTADQAAEILGLTGLIGAEAIKAAYRSAASRYHPDHGGSTEMMQAVNAAYARLADFEGCIAPADENTDGYGEALNDAINAIIGLPGLAIEVCGLWVWVGGDTRTHKDTLKASGYRWASKKHMWYFRPEGWTSSARGTWDIETIRENHGSRSVAGRFPAQLEA